MLGETVTVQTAGTVTNPYSTDPEPSWNVPPTEVQVNGVAVEPRPGGEPVTDARNAVVSGFTLYLPSEVQVTARNRVVVRGNTYEVLGEPAVWRSPFSDWAPGSVVQVQRVEG